MLRAPGHPSVGRVAARLLAGLLVGLTALLALPAHAFAGPTAGDSDFYATPESLPKDKPGTILRAEEITAPAGAKAWRVLYTSKAVDGRVVPVSGIVVAPDAPAPKGGRPVVAWAHGTTGVADVCAPSARDDAALRLPYVDDLVAAGHVVAATDYEGLGTEGVHPYLVGPSEGRGVLDAVRAARRLDGTGAGRDVVVWGHSQGGHAALFAGQLAKRYAPELDVHGVVAAAPSADVARIVPAASGYAPAAGFYVLAAKGFAAAYPDEIDLTTLFTPEALAASASADATCVIEVIRQFATSTTALAPRDLREDAALMKRLRQSSAGNRQIGAPVLVVQGTADNIVNKAFTDEFVTKACAQGDPLEYRTYEGSGHSDVLGPSKPDVLAWIAARFADSPPISTCDA